MRILLDHGVPVPLRPHLAGHTVATAYEMGWAELENGALLTSAEGAFDVLVTTDQNLRHQQNLSNRRIAVLVLPTTSWPKIQAHVRQVVDEIGTLIAGECRLLAFRDVGK